MAEIDVDELKRRYGTFAEPVTRTRDERGTAGMRSGDRDGDGARDGDRDVEGATSDNRRRKRATGGEAAAPTRRRRKQPAESPGLVGIFADDPVRRAALNDCARLLTGGRAYTEVELRRKLEAKEHAPATIDLAIASCIKDRLVDDDAYATSYVESRLRRGQGARRIRADLARRGIRGEHVESLLSAARESGDVGDAALVAARRKFARVDLDDQKARAKAMRFLLGRGFDGSQADAAVRQLRAETQGGDVDEA